MHAPVLPVLAPLSPYTREDLETGDSRAAFGGGLRMLLVEDDPSLRTICADLASNAGCQVTPAASVPEARALLEQFRFEVVLLDLHLPGGTGAELFENIRALQPRASVVVMTAQATVSLAVAIMRNGAFDFLYKPFPLDRFVAVLDAVQQHHKQARASRELRDRLSAGAGAGKLIGTSPGMQKVFRLISKVASTRHPVLVVGESGTGKETVARAIHGNGPSPAAPFVPVDCSPLAPDHLEREIFGQAQTSAGPSKPGLLLTAEQGTVFFSEVSFLSPHLQSRLMRALEEKRVTPLGGTTSSAFQARILASSSQDLQAIVASGRFRKDLYYRLNVVKIDLPPLRDRSTDVLLLADHFLLRQAREQGTPFYFSDEAAHFLKEYPWAGNVRELEYAIERACALSSDPTIHLGDLGTQIEAFARAVRDTVPAAPQTSPELPTMQEVERATILSTLEKLNGDKLLTARILGIGKTTLYRKLREFGVGDEPL